MSCSRRYTNMKNDGTSKMFFCHSVGTNPDQSHNFNILISAGLRIRCREQVGHFWQWPCSTFSDVRYNSRYVKGLRLVLYHAIQCQDWFWFCSFWLRVWLSNHKESLERHNQFLIFISLGAHKKREWFCLSKDAEFSDGSMPNKTITLKLGIYRSPFRSMEVPRTLK